MKVLCNFRNFGTGAAEQGVITTHHVDNLDPYRDPYLHAVREITSQVASPLGDPDPDLSPGHFLPMTSEIISQINDPQVRGGVVRVHMMRRMPTAGWQVLGGKKGAHQDLVLDLKVLADGNSSY